MNGIREWAIMLCSVSVGSAFVAFLIPDGNMKKSVNFVMSLFLLSIVIIPVCGKEAIDMDFPDIAVDSFPDEDDYKLEYDQFFIQSGENVVENQISEILENICKKDFNVKSSLQYNSEGNLVLSDILITVSEDDSHIIETIKSKVKNLTGLIPQVVIGN